ncbi:MAG: AAC(3) family N-acetyltransferase [Gammaproteobacteria bacterium]
MGLKRFVPAPLIPPLLSLRHRLRVLNRKLRGQEMDERRFRALLEELGFRPGAVVMVHSSMQAVAERVPGMEPVALISLLQEMLGEEGTLLMPTFPFSGLQRDYVQETREFKPRRTPSRMGLLTEVFRRTEGVIRSRHPTHPVAAWGRLAEELTADHHHGTAFGTTSPLYRLREHDGRVVALGASPTSFTVFHVAEELHPATHAWNYDDLEVEMLIVEKGRETEPCVVRPLRGDRKRNFWPAVEGLKERGILRHEYVRGLEIATTDAAGFLDGCARLIDEGRFQDMS